MKREEYLSAVKLLKDADNAYYNGSKELMSNKEYDKLRDQVSVYESENPDNLGYTNTVGHESSKTLSKVTHEYPALSLDKTKDVEVLASEFRKGAKACNGDSVVFMWKMDGGTAVATYKDGKLIRLATRGNGEIGSDITHNAPYIAGLPLEISYKGNLTVRGEIVMSYPDFEKYAIQCKCYSSRLDNTPIQEVYAGMVHYKCQKSMVITNNYFTNGALELAQSTKTILWDRNVIKNMLYFK